MTRRWDFGPRQHRAIKTTRPPHGCQEAGCTQKTVLVLVDEATWCVRSLGLGSVGGNLRRVLDDR